MKVEELNRLLIEVQFDNQKRIRLVDNFRHSYRIGFSGNRKQRRTARNLRLRVGSERVLWNKVMKEVKIAL